MLIASQGDIHSFAVGPHGSAWSRVANGAAAAAAQVSMLQYQVDPETCRATPLTPPRPLRSPPDTISPSLTRSTPRWSHRSKDR